jgi:hypothetical protein
MARSGDTKLLCHVAQMIIALSGVSLWPLSGGKSLLLCQHGSPRIPRGCSSHRRQEEAVRAALAASPVSTALNTAFVERRHGTDRNRNGRKVRRTACFSKDWQAHNAMTYFTMYSYNFCWPVRTLRVRQTEGWWHKRTPAMAAGLADHGGSLTEWLTFPVVPLK